VLAAFNDLGFEVVREAEHIGLSRTNTDGSRVIASIPNHRYVKSSTLRSILTRAEVDRADFLAA
jgi:hypothetical protein